MGVLTIELSGVANSMIWTLIQIPCAAFAVGDSMLETQVKV